MPIFKQQLFKRLQAQQGEGGEGGVGGTPQITPEVQALIDAQVSKATEGLKSKNSELLGKLKDTSESLKRFDGIDPDAVKNILAKFANDEEAGLIAKGDIETMLKKHTERMQADYDKKLQGESEGRGKAEAKAQRLAERALNAVLRDAAHTAGALPEALDDVVRRGAGLWVLNEEGDPVAMNGDEIVLGKDGKSPLSPKEWAESIRDAAPYFWPATRGSGAPGSSGGGGTPKTLTEQHLQHKSRS